LTVIEITKLRARLLANLDEKGKVIPAYKVAAACGIHNGTFSDYASGKIPFTHENLQAICQYFRCQPRDIAGWIRFEYAD
jgi:DNA-binding Xre family transcriptional regulator